jgi:polysaccharide export outer membrane protein
MSKVLFGKAMNAMRPGFLSALCASFLAASCSVPTSGPSSTAIASGAVTTVAKVEPGPTLSYALVDLKARLTSGIPDPPLSSLRGTFGLGKGGPSQVLIGVGDVLEVSIFESSKGGLFLPADAGSRPGNFVTLPRQTVGPNGTIKVPYAGQVRASGRSATEIQADIERRLAQKAIEPQVVIGIITQRATEVSVLGDVPGANKFPLNPAGDRVLDMVSRAGGIRSQAYETYVTLQRGGRSATIFFDRLVKDPDENIFIRPGDTVFVSRDQRTYTVLGAVANNGRFPFTSERVTLAEALGQADGLVDNRADPGRVYIYRVEPRKIAAKLGVDLTPFPENQHSIPVVYNVNLRDPSAFFATQKFQLADKDILYIGNADATEFAKLIGPVLLSAQTATNITQTGVNIQRISQ